ncbi:MAG: serine/threonine-protein kinase [Ilumatobacteraceae bacterium]
MSIESTLPELIGGRYHLERQIARGGMAEVWLATDTFLTREVAVKLLKPHLADDPVVTERFRREAVACAGLDHPNIVAVYDCFEHNSRQAVVMQYVPGKSLRELLDRRQRLGPELTIHIGASIAAGLDAAHRAGYVHRDVKPGNILLTPDGRCLLTDFGIAKALIATGDDLTNDNIMMGTAKYLSPELVRGKPLDGRADLYGLGLVLYECLAGRVPFIGETDADTALARLQREPTDLGRLRPSLSPQLIKVIHKLLARNPDHRFATGAETRAALISAGTGQHDHTTSITPPSGIESTTIKSMDEVQRVATTPTSNRGRIPGEPTSTLSPQRTPTRVPVGNAHPNHVHGNNRRLLGLIGAIVVLCAVVLWQVAKETQPGVPNADNTVVTPLNLEPLSIMSASSFDPNGDDGHENEAQIGALLDGNPETIWTTTCYGNKYFGSKKFVGFLLQLSRPAAGTLGVGMLNAPWTIEIYTAQDIAPGQLSEWGQPVDKSYSTTRQRGLFTISEPANYILVVLREVGRSNGCSDTNPYQGILSGVTFGEG